MAEHPQFEAPPVQLQPAANISVSIPEATPGPVMLSEPNTINRTGHTPEEAERLARKLHFSLGSNSPGVYALRHEFTATDTTDRRNWLASQEATKNQHMKQNVVREMLDDGLRSGRPVNQGDIEMIRSMTVAEAPNPQTIFERVYAKRYLEALLSAQDTKSPNTTNQALIEKPDQTYSMIDIAEAHVAKQEIAGNVQREMEKRYKDTGWVSYLADFGKTVIPGYSGYKLHNVGSDKTVSFLPGKNLTEQIMALYRLPPNQFDTLSRKAIEELARDNVILAKHFADSLVFYTHTSAMLDNVFAVAELADVASIGVIPLGKAVVRAGAKRLARTSTERVAERLKASLQANTPDVTTTDGLVVAGNLPSAAEDAVLRRVTRMTEQPLTPEDVLTVTAKELPGILDARVYARNPGTLVNERVDRITRTINTSNQNLKEALTEGMVIPRVGLEEAVQRGFAQAERNIRAQYPHLNDAVIDVIPVRDAERVFGGVDRIDTIMGHLDATLFETPEIAANFARQYRLAPGSYDIVSYKGNYGISIPKFVNETELEILQARILTDNAQPVTFWNNILGLAAVRTSEDTLSKLHTQARKVAQFGANRTLELERQAVTVMGKLNKQQKQRLNEVLEENRHQLRDYPQPDGSMTSLPGNWYDNYGDYEMAYRRLFKSNPTDDEVAAYFVYRNQMHWLYQSENLSRWRDLTRLGVEQRQITLQVPQADGKTVSANLPWFNARQVESLPPMHTQPFIVGFTDRKGKSRTMLSTRLSEKEREYLLGLQQKGYQVLQPVDITDPAMKSLFGQQTGPVHYVIAPASRSKPIDATVYPYRAGPRAAYESGGHFLKQQQSYMSWGQRWGVGDTVVARFDTLAEAKIHNNAWNRARELLRTGDDSLEQYVTRNLPYRSAAEFRAEFRGFGNAEARLNIETPMVLTDNFQSASDVLNLKNVFSDAFIDVTKSPHSMNGQLYSDFIQARTTGLHTIGNAGTKEQPIWNFTPVKQLDPMSTVNRAAHELINSRFFIDYQRRSVEDWATQFGEFMKSSQAEVIANPMRFLKEPQWIDGAPSEIVSSGMSSRRSILHLLGQTTPNVQLFNYVRDKILDNVGPTARAILEPRLWTKHSDPLAMIRGFAYTSKMGVWNPIQWLLQGQLAAYAAAIDGSPIRAAQASWATWALRMRHTGEGNIKFESALGAAVRTSMGISEDTFTELASSIKRSGIRVVEGELAVRDFLDPDVVQTLAGKVWSTNTFMARDGDRFAREYAYTISFLRWRSENPTAKLSTKVMAELVDKTDLLTMNMTRASSNPNWQGRGIPGTMSQFFTFQARVAEVMWSGGPISSGRLTVAQKVRLATLNMMMYGVAAPAGMYTGVIVPAGDIARRLVLENDQQADSWVGKGIQDGIISAGLESITGEKWAVGDRYGPYGMDALYDLLWKSDASGVMGAGPNIIKDALKNTTPFYYTLKSLFTKGSTDEFPLTAEIFLDMTREISTLNNLARGYYALRTGQILTRNEGSVDHVDAQMAAFTAMTGILPQSVVDAYLKGDVLRNDTAAKKALEKQALMYFKRALRAAAQNDQDEAGINFTRVKAILEPVFEPHEIVQIERRWMRDKENETLVNRVDRNWVLKGPRGSRLQRLETMQTRQRKREERDLPPQQIGPGFQSPDY